MNFRHFPNPSHALPACARFLFSALVFLASGSFAGAQLLTTGVNFQGVAYDTANTGAAGTSRAIPPSCSGDIGPSQFLVCVNGRIRTFNRAGTADAAVEMTTDAFFSSVRGGAPATDPRVRYDRLSGRWFVLMRTVSVAPLSNNILVAISSGSNIASAAQFSFYQFSVTVDPGFPADSFVDFPSMGVDKWALYIGANVFQFNSDSAQPPIFLGTQAYVVNKANLIAGTLIVTPLGELGSMASPQGVDNDDPAATEGYFIGTDVSLFGRLNVARVSDPGGALAVAQFAITVPNTNFPKGGVLPRGSNISLGDLDERLLSARMHKGRLWTAHNMSVLSTGLAPADSSGGDRDASRWYEIGTLSGTPSLSKWGTLFDSAATRPRDYWMPSCAMSGQGNMAIVASVARSGTASSVPAGEFAGIAASGRFDSDSAGDFDTPATTQAPLSPLPQVGISSYNLSDGASPHKWSAYSAVSVDPLDDMTFWSVHEYCNGTDSWGVRVIQFRAPPPAIPASASLPSLSQGQFNANLVITGTSSNGSGFFDPGAGFANHLSATFSGTGVTVNGIVFTDPTHITLNVTVASNATLGSRTVSVTNPDGQSAVSASGILTVITSVDTDGDGIPDWWMQQYFGHATGQAGDKSLTGNDADGDGMSNLDEYRAGTGPRSPASVLRVTAISVDGAGAHITFASLAGKNYRLEYKNNVSDASWTLVAANIPGSSGTTTAPDPAAVGMVRRFYRVLAVFP